MHHTHESHFLRPRDPSLTDSDKWPEYTISNAHIHQSDDASSSANLLHAGAGNVLTITGNLEPLSKETLRFVLQPLPRRAPPIEVTGVVQFAYGQWADGSVGLWAAGAAGWYTIKPGRAYRAVYDGMIEAIQLLYFIADGFSQPQALRKKGREGSEDPRMAIMAQDLFHAWAEKTEVDAETAGETVYKHHRFLLASMLAAKEDRTWTHVPIFRHLEHEFPDVTMELRKAMAVKPGRPKTSTPQPAASPKRKRASLAVGHTSESRPRLSVDGGARRTRASGTPASFLEQAAASPAPDKSNSNEPQAGRVRTRKSIDVLPATAKSSTLQAVIQDERSTSGSDGEIRAGQLSRKGKSALRPKTSKYIAQSTNDDAVQDGEDITQTIDNPTEMQTRPVTAKRKAEDDLAQRRSKRRMSGIALGDADHAAAGANEVDEGIDMSLDQEEQNDAETDGTSTPLPFELRTEDVAGDPEGDTWTCPLDGCLHRIYAASDPASQALIKEHYRLHVNDEDADMRMQLVRRMEAPGLPVGRLMGRIQAITGQPVFPAPIAQRY